MQEKKDHYFSAEYMRPERLQAYIDQIRTINLFVSPKDEILEIGVGNGYLANILKNHYHYSVTTLDFNEELRPDLLMDITQEDFNLKKKYDVGLCFEVLEHISWPKLPQAISNLAGSVRKNLIISVPDANFFVQMKLIMLWLKLTPLNLTITIPRFFNNKKTIGFGHEWEIGIRRQKSRTTASILISDVIKRENLITHYRGREFPGHHFFVIKGLAS